MSKNPGPIEKRDLLFGVKKTSREELEKLARAFESRGELSDAGDFFNQAKSKENLERLQQLAAQEGDTFLLNKMSRYLGQEISPDLLQACAENAEKAGKTRYAIQAYEALERGDKVAALREQIANDGDILAEAESNVYIPDAEEGYLDDLEGEAHEEEDEE